MQTILAQDNRLDFMEQFKGDSLCFVIGSSWPEDEAVLLNFINNSEDIKIVIAPHNVKDAHVKPLLSKLKKEAPVV